MNTQPMKLAVFGHPIAHSRSPEIHRLFANQAGISIDYQRIEAPLDGFEVSVRRFVENGGKGFNVTLPFKEEAFELMSQLTPAARLSGAVNTVQVTEDGGLLGDNTDGRGLVRDLEDHLGWPIHSQRVLIVGAGGAVKGVLPALLERQPRSLTIANRTVSRAQALLSFYRDRLNEIQPVTGKAEVLPECTVTDLARIQGPFDLIINGTSSGLEGKVPALPEALIHPQVRCYDMIYGKEETAFNGWAQGLGARMTSDGLGMLVEQAAAAFHRWTGFMPKTAPVRQTLSL